MIRAGMDVARVNFSHGTRAEHRDILAKVRRASVSLGRVVGVLADIPGPKLRITDLLADEIDLEEDQVINVVEGTSISQAARLPGVDTVIVITPLGVLRQLRPGDSVSFADGSVQATVLENLEDAGVTAQVNIGGPLIRRKGVNFPNCSINLPALSEVDLDHIRFAVDVGFDFIAISFVGEVSDVLHAKEIIMEAGKKLRPRLISKIERPNALADIEAIVRASDAVMVARGDLGVEIPPEAVPIEQKRVIHLCNEIGRPVITATQMLESMIHSPTPTRAEATDVANAIFDGTDAIMLSGETAMGDFPLEALTYMDRIARRTESELRNVSLTHLTRPTPSTHTVADAVALSATQVAASLPIRAVIAVTESGHSARVVSKFRPSVPVVGAAGSIEAAGSLTLSFGVTPTVISSQPDLDASMREAIDRAIELDLVKEGELVLLVAGLPFGVSGTTNLMKVQKVGEDVLGRWDGFEESIHLSTTSAI